LTQSGTDAPVATVLENTLGGTVVWTRDGAGNYTATLAGAFTDNKTLITTQNYWDISNYVAITIFRNDSDTINVQSTDVSTFSSPSMADSLISSVAIEILVYP
jgi:outer membrane lipoprotein SlyB